VHEQKVSACAQQIRTFRNQFGQSAWKAAVALREAMPARAVIRRNSGDTALLEVDNAHNFSFSAMQTGGSVPSLDTVPAAWWIHLAARSSTRLGDEEFPAYVDGRFNPVRVASGANLVRNAGRAHPPMGG